MSVVGFKSQKLDGFFLLNALRKGALDKDSTTGRPAQNKNQYCADV
jgi:hypothetical protein